MKSMVVVGGNMIEVFPPKVFISKCFTWREMGMECAFFRTLETKKSGQ